MFLSFRLDLNGCRKHQILCEIKRDVLLSSENKNIQDAVISAKESQPLFANSIVLYFQPNKTDNLPAMENGSGLILSQDNIFAVNQ